MNGARGGGRRGGGGGCAGGERAGANQVRGRARGLALTWSSCKLCGDEEARRRGGGATRGAMRGATRGAARQRLQPCAIGAATPHATEAAALRGLQPLGLITR